LSLPTAAIGVPGNRDLSVTEMQAIPLKQRLF
jgi:hypothetical protein